MESSLASMSGNAGEMLNQRQIYSFLCIWRK